MPLVMPEVRWSWKGYHVTSKRNGIVKLWLWFGRTKRQAGGVSYAVVVGPLYLGIRWRDG